MAKFGFERYPVWQVSFHMELTLVTQARGELWDYYGFQRLQVDKPKGNIYAVSFVRYRLTLHLKIVAEFSIDIRIMPKNGTLLIQDTS